MLPQVYQIPGFTFSKFELNLHQNEIKTLTRKIKTTEGEYFE
jgi:predicted cupin superfamily sugar epimerase